VEIPAMNTRTARTNRSLRQWQKESLCERCLPLVGYLALAFTAGCASYPVPLSAQAGSTMVVPLTATGGGGNTVIGFGGFSHTDYQRGTMVYQLDGPGGFELRTRFTIAAEPHASTRMASIGTLWGDHPEILSVVDIPPEAPEGTHSLHVIRRLPDGTEFPGPAYSPQIKILPNSIDVNGGAETVVGAYTPSAMANCTSSCGWAHLTSDAIPRPRIRITFGEYTDNIGAFELDLSYPASIINVVDAFEVPSFLARSANNVATVWFDDDGAGAAQVFGIAHPDFGGGWGIWTLDVVFELDDGAAQILDLSQDPVVVDVDAYDLDGNPLPGVTATVVGIR
jgi:hypothetical protein